VTRFVAPADGPGFLLWHATLRWQRAITATLAPMGLTHVQFVLLACTWWLNAQGAEPSQQEVATQAGTEIRMTSEVLRTLESKGFIVRAADPHDSRARALHTTRTGSALARRAVRAVESADAAFFGDVAGPPFVRALRTLAGKD
jgi:DNA-binding MarR family transcriptional regulator